MKAKQIAITIVLSLSIPLVTLFCAKHLDSVIVTETFTVKDKFPQYREGSVNNYFVIIEYSNGDVEEENVTVKEYTNFTVGKQYTKTHRKLVWK